MELPSTFSHSPDLAASWQRLDASLTADSTTCAQRLYDLRRSITQDLDQLLGDENEEQKNLSLS